MTAWPIKIEGDPATFVPELQSGPDLLAEIGDLVHWDNTTKAAHHPWPTDANFTLLTEDQLGPAGSPNYLSDEISADHPSLRGWIVIKPVIDGNVLYYCCKLHQGERGRIIVTTPSLISRLGKMIARLWS